MIHWVLQEPEGEKTRANLPICIKRYFSQIVIIFQVFFLLIDFFEKSVREFIFILESDNQDLAIKQSNKLMCADLFSAK